MGRRETSGCGPSKVIRGHSQCYGIGESKVEVKAKKGGEGCQSCCGGELLFSEFLQDESFWYEAC